jgi:hypothetical protein
MGQIDRIEGAYAWSAAGVKVPYTQGVGCLLLANTVYYFPFAMKDSGVNSVHMQWDANIILTSAIIEDSNLPAYFGGAETVDVTDYSAALGAWMQENPTTSYVTVTDSTGGTGGATVTNGSIAVAGGTAGGAMYNISAIGSRRGRLHVVVAGTGGVLRVHTHGKSTS